MGVNGGTLVGHSPDTFLPFLKYCREAGGLLRGAPQCSATVLPNLTSKCRFGCWAKGCKSARLSFAGADASAEAPYQASHCNTQRASQEATSTQRSTVTPSTHNFVQLLKIYVLAIFQVPSSPHCSLHRGKHCTMDQTINSFKMSLFLWEMSSLVLLINLISAAVNQHT